MEINFQDSSNQQSRIAPENAQPISGGNNKNFKGLAIGIIIILVVAAGAVYAFKLYNPATNLEPQTIRNEQTVWPVDQNQLPVIENEDSTASISQQIDGINILDIDKEFKDIDADINSL
ncbi:MAG: hypothetical protein A2174_00305 [Candidatus Portnoybacteria bacterium RBG_13_41_18]|uniref:Uncharacterized protein n=1 Tax=Candidatus Portnoybacteria bacterium RBG_13_41_18 TaxID=1801991 RepID=A0A1G2FBD2_9BACT|nr:MAG: hypothetical protein A2174_00305 [Candidatus Portnoybacteria bacterium RBG_13_41_18]